MSVLIYGSSLCKTTTLVGEKFVVVNISQILDL